MNENQLIQKSALKVKVFNSEDENNLSFNQKFYKDIDTSELVKRRQENEAYLEEIEKSIMDNIESTRSIINQSKKISVERQDNIQNQKSTSLLKYNKRRFYVQEEGYNRNKFNYHKILKKNKKLGDSKNKDIMNYLDDNMQNLNNFSEPIVEEPPVKIDDSCKRTERIVKSKAFQEDAQSNNKDLIRIMSHVSFTNQTDMFDHFDSQNSFGNDKFAGSTNHEVLEST